jgi:signal transduction histidine kinase
MDTNKTDRRDHRGLRALAWLFIIAILVPTVLLSVLAIRSASREEAFIEKELQTTLQAELSLVNTRADAVLQMLLDSLTQSADSIAVSDIEASLSGWSERSDGLIAVAFLFDRRGEFVWPRPVGQAEREFLDFNTAFFTDRTTIDVYQSVAQIAQKDIPAKQSSSSSFLSNQIESQFEQDADLQKKSYEYALKTRKRLVSRTVKMVSKSVGKDDDFEQASRYATESLRFSQIIADKDAGLIPRLIDDRMMLLFWKKLDTRLIVGGTIDLEKLKLRLQQTLPQLVTTARIITILDQKGVPIAQSELKVQPDWRNPFAARELGERLPRWEVAAYLTSADSIHTRARLTAFILVALVIMLFIAVALGSFWALRLVRSEVIDAQHKTTFVANVSHELKTPLTSIRLFAELLMQGRQTDPVRQQKYLGIIVSEVERLTRLINNVLDFSRTRQRGRTYRKRRVELSAICRELIETQRVRLEHNRFMVELHLPGDEIFIEADDEALKQALLNILSNAEKYSTDEKWIAFTLSHADLQASITVDDHGFGIAPHQREAIFREFFRVDDTLTTRVQGSGLGLTISRKIIRDHGGDIVCSGLEPHGSRFTITIPLIKETIA